MTITIDLLRHGDVAGGTRLLGHTDAALSELGWTQLRNVVNNRQCPWTEIISSPLQRCHLFAQEIATQLQLPLRKEPDLKEISFGEWEGALFEDLYKSEHADQLRAFWQNPAENPALGGEFYMTFEDRVLKAWQKIVVAQMQQESSHLLLVIHGGVIRTLLRGILDFPIEHFFRIDVPYACLSRIEIAEGIPRLVFHGGQLSTLADA